MTRGVTGLENQRTSKAISILQAETVDTYMSTVQMLVVGVSSVTSYPPISNEIAHDDVVRASTAVAAPVMRTSARSTWLCVRSIPFLARMSAVLALWNVVAWSNIYKTNVSYKKLIVILATQVVPPGCDVEMWRNMQRKTSRSI